MKGVYTAAGKISTVTSAKTLAYLTAPSAKVVEILSVTVTNSSNATNAQLEAFLANITTVGTPTGYSALTPTSHEKGEQAAGTTVNLATSATSQEPTTYGSTINQEGFASLVGYRFEPPSPDERIYVAPGAALGLRLNVAPTLATDLDVRITFKEIG